MNYQIQNAELVDLEVQVSKEEALYIVIGMEDGWLKYNKKSYEGALKWLERHGKSV